VSKSASDISLCNCKAVAREISSPAGVCSTISFPIPLDIPFPFCFLFPSLVAFPSPVPSSVPYPFVVPVSPLWESSSPSPWSLSFSSPGTLRPLLGALEYAHFSSSLSSSIIPSQFSGPTPRTSHIFYCQQFGGSILAMGSTLFHQEKRSLVHSTIPDLVFCALERSVGCLQPHGLSHMQMFVWSRVLPNICPTDKLTAAHHSGKDELLLRRCRHISWNCEQWRVMTGPRKIVSL
jgi:hypothetical protein